MISPYFACPAFRSKNLAGAAGCLVALAFSGIASAAEALPQLVLPGRGAVDGRRIVPYDNAWSVVQQKPDGTIVHVGVATDHVARVMLEGKSYLLRIEGEIDD